MASNFNALDLRPHDLDWMDFTMPTPSAAHLQAARDGVTLIQIPPRLSRRGGREPGRSPERAKSPFGAAPTCNCSIGSTSGSAPLSWPETACLVLIMFGLLYFAEIIAEAATRG